MPIRVTYLALVALPPLTTLLVAPAQVTIFSTLVCSVSTMSTDPANSPKNNSHSSSNTLTPIGMQESITELQMAVDHLKNCQQLFKSKNSEINYLKSLVSQYIEENEALKSTMDYLSRKAEGKCFQTEAHNELIKLLNNTFANKLSIESSERKLAFSLLKRLDSEIDQALITATMKSMSGLSASELVLEIRSDLEKIRTGIGARLKTEVWSKEGEEATKYFAEKGWSANNKKDENDTKMDT